MKIAIASTGKNEDSEVNPVAGRSPYFLVYEKGKLLKVIRNPFAVGGGGAGFGVAEMLANEGIGLIVAGHYGSNMIDALKNKRIKKVELSNMTIKEALKKIKDAKA